VKEKVLLCFIIYTIQSEKNKMADCKLMSREN